MNVLPDSFYVDLMINLPFASLVIGIDYDYVLGVPVKKL
jgi:hypothetical protein